jgi:phosphoribosylformimino-5-aminoimidazole carboxamide ribotide isomerase
MMRVDAGPKWIERMRVVGGRDIRGGRAVHARAGRREEYAPVSVAAGEQVDGDPTGLARVYVDVLGVRELYLADLDAIAGGPAAMNADAIRQIAALGVPVWVDAGVTTSAAADAVLGAGAATVVVGLETLTSFDVLHQIVAAAGGQRAAFSLDLRDGAPITATNAGHATSPATDIARRAAKAGVGTVIVLDLARVGTAAGIDIELLAAVRRAAPEPGLFAGGGVRSAADLDQLARAGCDGALVATALLSGALRLT